MLAVCLILAGMNTAVSAIETNAPAQSGSDYVLVDASQDIALYDGHTAAQAPKALEYTKAYGASSYSYKWCPGDEKAVASSKLSGSSLYDLSAYENGYMNLRVYIPSGIAGSSSNKRIAMRIHMKCDTAGTTGDPVDGHHCLRYDTVNLKSYKSGWNDISVKIDSFNNKVTDNQGSHTAADILKAVDYVEIGSSGIISGYANEWSGVTANLYIDKLWLSTSALSSDSDIYTVEDYTSGKTHSWRGAYNACYIYSSPGSFYVVDNTKTLNGALHSVHWDNLNGTTEISGSSKPRTALYARMLNASKTAVESKVVDKYNYVNAWVYSNAEANQNLYLKMYFDMDNDRKGNAKVGQHYIDNVNDKLNVNWTGWKLVSYRIKDMRIRPNESDLGGSYSWGNGSIKINSVGFEAVKSDECDKIDLNIDSIFFSVNECSKDLSLVSAGTAKTDDLTSSFVAPYDKTAVLTFNGEIDASTASVSATANGVALDNGKYDVQVIGDKIYVHFHNDLPESSTVTVTVADSLKSVYRSKLASPVTVTLNTKAASEITWNDSSVTIANNLTADLSGLTLYAAGYADDGSLVSVTTQDISVPAAESKTFEYTASAQAKNKVFIWDTNLKPLCVENGR